MTTFRTLDRYTADVGCDPEPTPAEDRQAARDDLEWNSAIECAESKLDALIADLMVQAKGHGGCWDDVFDGLDFVKSCLPEKR